MNKKLMATLGTVAVGGVLLGTTAYAAISETSGYDLYKQALKNTYGLQAFTPTTEVIVTDNGKEILQMNAVGKIDKATKTASKNIVVETEAVSKTVNIYSQADQTVLKTEDSEVYKVLESKGKHPHNPEHLQDVEKLIDALTGNVQKLITVKAQADGSKDVSLELTDTQVSPVVNAVASMVVKHMDMERQPVSGGFHDGLDVKLPKLVDNIKVSKIQVAAEINKDNLIEAQEQSFSVSGTDANGVAHELVITIETEFTGFNNTTPDTVDLTGKATEVVEFKHPR